MFDLNILPMNLVNGRNLGELPGLKIYTAPKRCDKSRQNDVFIVLITCAQKDLKLKEIDDWGTILSDAYFSARGSFTMGISMAARQLAAHLNEKYPGTLLPEVYLNIAILRDRTLLIGHAGPVNSTVVYADHVDNFSDITSGSVTEGSAGLRFFQAEIHSGDLILLCPSAPHGWTNEAILDATSESPLNVVRYLLDQARGNLQGAVVQVKAGRGEILYRYKPPITTDVNLGYDDDSAAGELPRYQPPEEKPRVPLNISTASAPAYLLGSDDEKTRPLFRIRLPLEPFPVDIPMKFREEPVPAAPVETEAVEAAQLLAMPEADETTVKLSDPADVDQQSARLVEVELAPPSEVVEMGEAVEQPASQITGESALTAETEESSEKPDKKRRREEIRQRNPVPKKRTDKRVVSQQTKKTIRWKRVLIGLVFGLMIPLVVVAGLFLMYTNRSKDAAYRDSLENAVNTAKVAVQQTQPSLQRVSWEKVLEYLDEAALYGRSEASRELKSQALEALDKLENSRSVIYNYALSKALPASTWITQIETTDQFLYALDQTSGSILRFNIYANGLTQDSAFSCTPGTYRNLNAVDDAEQIKLDKMVDFVILPSESGQERIVAGIDQNAQLLLCPSVGEKKAIKFEAPPIGWLGVNAIELRDRMLYVLDARNNAIWKFPYIGKNGFMTEPQTYFGSSAPGMRDAVDFIVYANFAYILRNSGTLIVCDYTGYIPLCSYVDELKDAEGNITIDLMRKNMIQMKMNLSPDNSLYLIDEQRQSILNISVKLNLIRTLAPERFHSQGWDVTPTAFGFIDQHRVIWAAGNVLYSGSIR